MKRFLKDYSYYAVKMFLNQFGLALFGLTLSLVFSRAQSRAGQLWSSVGAVLFYLFLIYYMTWQLGERDRKLMQQHGDGKISMWNGLLTALLANSLNFIFAIFNLLGVGFFGIAALLLEGMYAGILMMPYKTVIENGEAVELNLTQAWWMYFLIIVPTLIVAGVSYYFGRKNMHLTPIFEPVNPEKKKRK